MKGIVILLLTLAISVNCYAATVPTKVSGNSVTFSTVGTIVTFNSIAKRVRIINESTLYDVYVDPICKDANGKTGYFTRNSAVIKVGAYGSVTPNTIEFDLSTKNLAFISDEGIAGARKHYVVDYVVFGDVNDL